MRPTSNALRRWASSLSATQWAAELLPSPSAPGLLADALARIAPPELEGSSFFLVRIGQANSDCLKMAVAAANGFAYSARLCLAVDAPTLRALPLASIDEARVGLVLDDIDAHTPLTELAREGIEAIRFRPEFVARAMNNLRVACILRSMLLLAHNLGLCTLGSGDVAGSEQAVGFDYVPDSSWNVSAT